MSSAAQICFCSRSKATQKPSAQSKNSCPKPLPGHWLWFTDALRDWAAPAVGCDTPPGISSVSLCVLGPCSWHCLCAGCAGTPVPAEPLLLPVQGPRRVHTSHSGAGGHGLAAHSQRHPVMEPSQGDQCLMTDLLRATETHPRFSCFLAA